MITIQNTYNSALVYAETLDSGAEGLIRALCGSLISKGSSIRIMPDVHAGKGCAVGTTMTIKDCVAPGLVGVDIGCGMLAVKFHAKRLELQKLDKLIHDKIPAGKQVRSVPHHFADKADLDKLLCLRHDIIAVSSLIDWMTADGTEIDADSIESLPVSDIENLQIAFDGRYHIEELFNILEKAILDFSARMGLRMALKLQEVVRRIANQLNKSFSAMSATVALSPIPISDIYILLLLQGILVCLIASLSGRDISLDTAKEFVLSMGGIAGAGYGFRLLAQQASKILNVFWAGSGSAVSASIAALGTSAIGKAAIAYYIDDKTIEEAKSTFEASRKED